MRSSDYTAEPVIDITGLLNEQAELCKRKDELLEKWKSVFVGMEVKIIKGRNRKLTGRKATIESVHFVGDENVFEPFFMLKDIERKDGNRYDYSPYDGDRYYYELNDLNFMRQISITRGC